MFGINLVPWLLRSRGKQLIELQYLSNGNVFYFVHKYCIYFNYRFKDDGKNRDDFCLSFFFFFDKKKISFIYNVAHFAIQVELCMCTEVGLSFF